MSWSHWALIPGTAIFLVVYLVPQATGLRINTSTSMPRGWLPAASW